MDGNAGRTMEVVESILAARRACHRARIAAFGTDHVGLIAIRQSLHGGHLSLVQRARDECGIVAVVLDRGAASAANQVLGTESSDPDAEALAAVGVDILFRPISPLLSAENATRVLTVEGAFPAPPEMLTFFVTLLHIFTPERLYFGELDALVFAGLRRATQDLAMTVQVIAAPTARDKDELPLGWEAGPLRQRAVLAIPAALDAMRQVIKQGETGRDAVLRAGTNVLRRYPELKVEYLEILDAEMLSRVDRVEAGTLVAIAARMNGNRLTDAFYVEEIS